MSDWKNINGPSSIEGSKCNDFGGHREGRQRVRRDDSQSDQVIVEKKYYGEREERGGDRRSVNEKYLNAQRNGEWSVDRNANRYDEKERWGKHEVKMDDGNQKQPPIEKEQPNFKLSGSLSKQLRTTKEGVLLKFVPPKEARIPILKWRLYPFKNDESLDPFMIYQKAVYILGRDRSVVDIPLDHQSCSLQHAVIVHRQVTIIDKETNTKGIQIHPYIMDLKSTNGTFLNDTKLDDSRFYQLLEKDSIRFGSSTREYIIINEKTGK